MSKLTAEDVERAEEIVREMQERLEEFKRIVRRAGSTIYNRFHAYPEGHIEMALSNDHGWCGQDMFTLQGLAENMKDEVESEFYCVKCEKHNLTEDDFSMDNDGDEICDSCR